MGICQGPTLDCMVHIHIPESYASPWLILVYSLACLPMLCLWFFKVSVLQSKSSEIMLSWCLSMQTNIEINMCVLQMMIGSCWEGPVQAVNDYLGFRTTFLAPDFDMDNVFTNAHFCWHSQIQMPLQLYTMTQGGSFIMGQSLLFLNGYYQGWSSNSWCHCWLTSW